MNAKSIAPDLVKNMSRNAFNIEPSNCCPQIIYFFSLLLSIVFIEHKCGCLLFMLQFLVRKIRCRLALIYRALGDEDQYNTHFRLANQTDAALGLNCGACGELFGLRPENLEALPCAHILHAR